VIALHVRVTRGKHGGEAGDLLFTPTAFARFLEVTATTNRAQGSFAIKFLFQPSQHFLDGLAFLQSYLSQLNHFLSNGPWTDSAPIALVLSGQGRLG